MATVAPSAPAFPSSPSRGSLPVIRDNGPLSAIRHDAPETPPAPDQPAGAQVLDLFVSHASEGKELVAAPLAAALEAAGLSVWLHSIELKIGDSLRRKIDQGIRSSRFAIVIFPDRFFAKGWTPYELDGIVTMTVSGHQTCCPSGTTSPRTRWVVAHSPSLADKVARSRSTATHTIQEIATEITSVAQGDS